MGLNLLDPAFVGVVGSGGGGWEETFNFESDSGWVKVQGTNGLIDVDNPSRLNKLSYELCQDLCTSTVSKLFAEGTLSDTMFTMLSNEVIWNTIDTVPSGLFYGGSDNDLPMKDSNNKDFLGGLMAGCGPTNTGEHGCAKNGTIGVGYSACWTGNGSGSDNWDTLFRTSATGARYIVYPTSARSSSDFDDTWVISSATIGLDRLLGCSHNDGGGGRRSSGTIDEIIFKDGVNSE